MLSILALKMGVTPTTHSTTHQTNTNQVKGTRQMLGLPRAMEP
jgi:hypothetical protein